jgi:hypothetical protein
VQSGVLDGGVPPPLLLVATFALGAMPQLIRRAAGGRAPFAALPGPEALADASMDLLMRAIGTRQGVDVSAKARSRRRKPSAKRKDG